jgi:hypothetical protein
MKHRSKQHRWMSSHSQLNLLWALQADHKTEARFRWPEGLCGRVSRYEVFECRVSGAMLEVPSLERLVKILRIPIPKNGMVYAFESPFAHAAANFQYGLRYLPASCSYRSIRARSAMKLRIRNLPVKKISERSRKIVACLNSQIWDERE